MKVRKKAFGFLVVMLVFATALGQMHLPPVAVNDSASVIQPYIDTINVTANDSSPSGDSFCIKKVYGSSFFTVLDCNNIIFKSDSSAFGNDTARYVICNMGESNLCDTGMVVMAVQRHYTPFMLNNSKWTIYEQDGDCDNGSPGPGDFYYVSWTYYWTTDDTVINGLSYKTLYSKQDQGNISCGYSVTDYTIGGPYLYGYLRQDTANRLVMFLGSDSASERVIYDFNIGLNDTIYADEFDTSYTNSYNYYESNGTYYRSININNYFEYLGWGTSSSSWIEGFGSTLGLFSPYGGLGAPELLCFSTNGQAVYPYYATDTCAYIPVGIPTIPTLQTSIHPNPTTGFCTLQLSANSESLSASIFDLTGREVLPLFTNQTGATFDFNVSSLADGVYFVKVFASDGHVGIVKLVKE